MTDLAHLIGNARDITIELFTEVRRFDIYIKRYLVAMNCKADKHPELWAVAGIVGRPEAFRKGVVARLTMHELEAADPSFAQACAETVRKREPLF
jgi:hypothetical protein